ncbi:MAG: hypothetical protein LAT75_14295 [Candidatus Cyclonatronum sp.]|uniref:hypothetical protein n=1 Tax=Cyclonatronum sp. TaxID=3024185 RepID=UPI0025C3C1C1|nr:hypothetical protein [Cyclonatronum sp.]MCH8488029.1 hypothetical protein [Cyclonatronum sp.]
MKFDTYFKHHFPSDLRRLHFFERRFRTRSKSNPYESGLAFGNAGWSNMRRDLAGIPVAHRELFVLSLFFMVLTDQVVFARFPEVYPNWSKATHFPKFAQRGFCARMQNPLYLLETPERASAAQQMVNVPLTAALLPEAVESYFSLLGQASSAFLGGVSPAEIADAIERDQDFQFGQGELCSTFRAAFSRKLAEISCEA